MILIVDSDAATRASLRLLLECEGFTVRGEHGTGMGTAEFCEALRRRDAKIAAILVTAHASPKQRDRACAAGFAAVLETPYTLGEMLEAVQLATRH
jgi:CheY-like chemotaxis protein